MTIIVGFFLLSKRVSDSDGKYVTILRFVRRSILYSFDGMSMSCEI
jgi:hypothetical protein